MQQNVEGPMVVPLTDYRPIILRTVSILPDRPDASWQKKFHEGLWLASATLAQPCASAIEEAEGVLKTLKEYCSTISLNEFNQKVFELGHYYRNRFFESIQTIFGLNVPEESIVFEDNGRTAIFAAVQICQPKHVLTTSEEPGHVTLSLRGDDPWAHIPIEQNYVPANDFFHPNRRSKGNKYDRKNIPIDVVEIETLKEKSDEALMIDFVEKYQQSLESDNPIDFVMVPHVSRVGRLLPVKEISKALKKIAKDAGRQLTVVIDGVQAVGRTYAEELLNPFEYADIYLFNSTKGVAAQLTKACLLVEPNLLKSKLEALKQNDVYKPYIRNLQFSESLLSRDQVDKMNPDYFTCVGPTELAGFVGALEAYVGRGPINIEGVKSLGLIEESGLEENAVLSGDGFPFMESHKNRRRVMMAEMKRQRNEVIHALEQIGVTVYDPKGVPIIPHIIILNVPNNRGVMVKRHLQSGMAPVTTARLVGEALRIGLPEDPYIPATRIINEFIRPLLKIMNGPVVSILKAFNQVVIYKDPGIGNWKIGRVDQKLIDSLGINAHVHLEMPDELATE
jgi:hypothetical protein